MRKFKVNLRTGQYDVDADDVVVAEGFVIFLIDDVDEEDDTNRTLTTALFNGPEVIGIMEMK